MSTITKERAKDILEFGAGRIISPITDDEIMELARIALASLEAEAVAEVCEGFTLRYIGHGPAPKSGVHIGDRLYTATPVPVMPDGAINRAVDEIMATYAGSADECRKLVRKHIEDACHAAMLQGGKS